MTVKQFLVERFSLLGLWYMTKAHGERKRMTKIEYGFPFPSNGRAKEEGLSIVEVLVALVFSSLVALGLTHASSVSFLTSHNSLTRSVAMILAMERLEEYSAINPDSLTAAMNQTQTLTRGSINYQRVTTVSINADRTRQIAVQVTHDCGGHDPITVTLTSVLVLRGQR